MWRFGTFSYDDSGGVAFWPPRRPFFTVGRGRYTAVPYGPLSPLSPEFGSGWYAEESELGADGRPVPFRWMGAEGVLAFPGTSAPARLDLRVLLPVQFLPQRSRLALTWNGAGLESVVSENGDVARTYRISADRMSATANELRLSASATFSPAAAGVGADARPLGAQLRYVRLASE